MGQIVEFSRAREPDHRVFSCSQARLSSFLVLASQIIEFSRAHGPDRRVFSCSRARSSSFLVVVAPKRVPGRPEAKNSQILNRNGLLEAILEASRPASQPASQAQPLGRVFSTKRVRGQNRRVFSRSRVRSSSFFVQIGSQRVPEHPEAKSSQILIRNGLLEAILEASRPASQPASQAQPLGRVFSTKRVRGQNRRVFSCSRVRLSSFFARVSDRRVFSCSRATGDQIVEFSRAQGPDRRVSSRSRARSSSFLALKGQIVEFSRA